MGGSKKATVGYRYYMGLHVAACLGPVDAVLELRAGGRTAWSGSQTSSGSVSINAPNLFGGEEREGGIQGTLDVMMGEATQAANSYLTARQGLPQPAYRGLLSLVFRQGLVACNNPYIKPWAIKVRRILAGWQGGAAPWYPAKAEIALPSGDRAANPAHIAYECLTNVEWGMGYSPGMIDDANFRAAADVFHAEGMGLCLQWTRQDTIEAFLQVVMDHAGAVIGQNRRTGLFVLNPIRGNYDIESLPVFDEGNIIALDSCQAASIAEATNEITVRYTDVTTGKDGSVTVQNLANITSQGGVVSKAVNYPGLPTAALATRCALRDLRAVSTPIKRVRMRCNREAWALLPGGLIRMTWPKLGITGMVLRLLSIDYGTLTDGTITIEAAEDVFGLPATTYAAQQPSGWQDPNTYPAPAANRLVEEMSYYELVRSLPPAELAAVPDDAGFLATIAARPSGDSLDYSIQTNTGSGYIEAGFGSFAPTATLSSALAPGATSATLQNMVDADLVRTGTYAVIGGLEVVRVDTFNPTTGAITFGRGVLDTVARAHSAGARIFFAQDYIGTDAVEYVDNQSVSVRLLPSTGKGRLAIGSAPTDTVIFDQRQFRPYPPGRLRINAQAYPVEIIDAPLTVSWAHRNRRQQNLEGDESGNIGPEPGTTYTLQLYNHATNTLIQQWTGLSGTSQALPALSGAFQLRVELWSVRSGLASRQKHVHVFDYINIGYRITEDGGQRITEDGDVRITEQ